MKIDVEAKVYVHEVDGQECKVGDRRMLTIRSHWNRGELVRLSLGDDGTTFAVEADRLLEAIRAATAGR